MLDFDGGGSLETDEFCQGRTSVPVPELSRDYPNTNIHTNIILYYNILYYTKLYFFLLYNNVPDMVSEYPETKEFSLVRPCPPKFRGACVAT